MIVFLVTVFVWSGWLLGFKRIASLCGGGVVGGQFVGDFFGGITYYITYTHTYIYMVKEVFFLFLTLMIYCC